MSARKSFCFCDRAAPVDVTTSSECVTRYSGVMKIFLGSLIDLRSTAILSTNLNRPVSDLFIVTVSAECRALLAWLLPKNAPMA